MYSEWVSLPVTAQAEEKRWSVLHKLPGSTGRDVVIAVVKPLALNLGISTPNCEPSNLKTDKEVQWCMEVICYGLSLPLSEHEAIRDCVHVYCEWIMALTKPKACVPKPVCEDPNNYARRMIQHLYNLFLPRTDSGGDVISRQAMLCHRVLRTIKTVAQDSNIMERETWDALLLFLLAVNDTLLAPPSVSDDIGSQLCERILGVLFEVWLLACHRCFPTPPLWKTFRELCCSWHHRTPLIDQWNRVNLVLTVHVLNFMYGLNFSEVKIPKEDKILIPSDMTNECIAQAWFRFLHTLGNPVDLCRPEVISKMPKFHCYNNKILMDNCHHPCLNNLPHIFLKAMKGIATLVDAFLGMTQVHCSDIDDSCQNQKVQTSATQINTSATPPHNRRSLTKSLVVAASAKAGVQRSGLIAGLTGSKGSSSNVSTSHQDTQPPSVSQSPIATPTAPLPPPLRPLPSPSRPKCNSILHLFGAWLFEASLISTELASCCSDSDQVDSIRRRHNSLIINSRSEGTSDIAFTLSIENFEAGQAEAIGALCRLFCAKRTGEEILPVYLARFYLAVQYGLMDGEARGLILSSILLNSCDLLRQDLDGVMVLVPHLLHALELVLPERELKIKPHPNIPQSDLRQASIHLLLSMLPLPLHFHNLPIKDLSKPSEKPLITFQSLRPRLINLLINALQVESDSTNTQMLLGGLLLCVQDAAASEEVEQVTQSSGNEANLVESVSTLLCSVDHPEVIEVSRHGSLTDSTIIDAVFNPSLDEQSEQISADSAHALFMRATYLVCHRLISSWKADLNVSLAALEVLSGLARIHLPLEIQIIADSQVCQKAVKWICDYIVYQCSRPPPAHSKDLHSTIVAAYHCVTTWLLEHPDLLENKDCVRIVLEVVELGISGSKSLIDIPHSLALQNKLPEPPRLKGEKELKPVSMRVKDAAESVLICMLDHVGYFPPPCGSETLSSLLDEKTLLQYCNSWNGSNFTPESAIEHFRYFVTDNSIILALLEEHLGNDQDPQPTVTALIRGPFGRNAWAMQLRHLPRHKSGSKMQMTNPGRPLPMNNIGIHYKIRPRYFPECVERIPLTKADKSIPSLESVIGDPVEHEKLSKLVDNQIAFEEAVEKQIKASERKYPNPETECRAPSICQEFQTSRLLLSHLGLLSLETLKDSLTQPLPSLMALDQKQSGFFKQLDILDKISTRTSDTVFVFYMRSGQASAEEILDNVTNHQNVHPHFLEFLLSLGWPVDVSKHSGWTGHTSTAWKVMKQNEDFDIPSDHGGSLYNGEHQVLYWSDVLSEIAFVVPSSKTKSRINDELKDDDDDSLGEVTLRIKVPPRPDTSPKESDRRMTSLDEGSDSSHSSDISKPRALSLNLESPDIHLQSGRSSGRKFGRQQSTSIGCEAKVIVVWLESLDDYLSFPLSDLLPHTTTGLESNAFTPRCPEKDSYVIFIHALQSGLFHIKMQGPIGRMTLALPLVDGMVVSRRTLGTLVRQTALNLCRRKRLDSENCPPPHVRRRQKIQDIVSKYHLKLSEPEFYTSLFSSAVAS